MIASPSLHQLAHYILKPAVTNRVMANDLPVVKDAEFAKGKGEPPKNSSPLPPIPSKNPITVILMTLPSNHLYLKILS